MAHMKAITIPVAASLAVLSLTAAGAQIVDSVQQAFEAGLYSEAVQLLGQRRDARVHTPADAYLGVQALLKLNDRESAKAELMSLAEQPDPAWRLIAQSATALIDKDTARARELAEQAVKEFPDQLFATYQLGLVAAEQTDWNRAAAAFARASEIDPAFAYARYYAGLSFSRISRMDLTAAHFEAFLNLAPKAPERAAVESIMRTLRGR
jgi:tetratricopeptide (TPR) repeat protein